MSPKHNSARTLAEPVGDRAPETGRSSACNPSAGHKSISLNTRFFFLTLAQAHGKCQCPCYRSQKYVHSYSLGSYKDTVACLKVFSLRRNAEELVFGFEYSRQGLNS